MTALRQVILGTAGHIDHGKSSLVRALTGVDPDRLAEEQARGMTIDLGFAPYRHRSGELVGVIDVPGHERFVKNMVAGATSVDVVLLVVAADDGVMPQTREHLAILGLLGVRRGLVALNKVDLVDPALAELARADVEALLRGTFLEGAPVLAVSAVTGAGLPALREAIDDLVDAVPPRGEAGPFRLPVQRVFSAAGHGTVATGVPVSGRVAPGDELEVVGRELRLRVRGVQAYGTVREAGRAGHSTALNVSGAGREDLRRGDVLATPGVFAARRRVSLHYRQVGPAPLRNATAVRLHAGTAELLGSAVVLDGDAVAPGAEAFVQLRLEEPVTVAPGDRCLLRHAASLAVLGGGLVLASTDGRLKRFKERVLEEARERLGAQGDPLRLARVALAAAGRRGLSPAELAREVGRTQAELLERLAPLLAGGEVLACGAGRLVDGATADELEDALDDALREEHRAQPLLEWAEIGALRRRVGVDEELLGAVLARGTRCESAPGGRVRRRGWRPQVGPRQRAAREALLAALRAGGASPPPVAPLLEGLDARERAALLAMMRAAGEIVPVGEHWFAAEVEERLRGIVRAHGRARAGAIDIPALRDELGTTRKYLIPLLEHFDASGLTVRHGERRTLRHVEGAP